MDPNIEAARREHVRLSNNFMMCDWSGEASFYMRGETYNRCSSCKKILWSIFDETISYRKSVRRAASR